MFGSEYVLDYDSLWKEFNSSSESSISNSQSCSLCKVTIWWKGKVTSDKVTSECLIQALCHLVTLQTNEKNRSVGHQLDRVTTPHGIIFNSCIKWRWWGRNLFAGNVVFISFSWSA